LPERQIRISRGESNILSWEIRQEFPRSPTFSAKCDRDASAPALFRYVTRNDERNECPPFPVGRQDIEVMPFRPAILVRHAVRRQMKMIDLMAQLGQRWSDPFFVSGVVSPAPCP